MQVSNVEVPHQQEMAAAVVYEESDGDSDGDGDEVVVVMVILVVVMKAMAMMLTWKRFFLSLLAENSYNR